MSDVSTDQQSPQAFLFDATVMCCRVIGLMWSFPAIHNLTYRLMRNQKEDRINERHNLDTKCFSTLTKKLHFTGFFNSVIKSAD